MGNYETTPDPRMRNGWAEYQRLVLAELERHNELINNINKSLTDIGIQLALMKEENGKIKTLQVEVVDLNRRMNAQDTNTQVGDALDKYKKWIIGAIVAFVISVAIPLLNILLGLQGIGK